MTKNYMSNGCFHEQMKDALAAVIFLIQNLISGIQNSY